MVDEASKKGSGCFLLIKDGSGGLAWQRLEVPSGERVGVDRTFAGNPSSVALYSASDATYYKRDNSVSSRDFLRALSTAPWMPWDADGVKVDVGVRNSKDGSYVNTTMAVSRYDLAGRWGQLLKDAGDAACKSGILIALVDAFVWMREVLSSPCAAGISPLYVVVGFGVGALLYLLGLFLKYLFGRFYGSTPAAKIVEAEAQT